MKNWMPFSLGVLAIVITQIACTWVLLQKLDHNDTSELSTISGTLEEIDKGVDSVAHSTQDAADNLEYMSETPEERLRKRQERMQSVKPQ
jgi:hypothetical protein